MDDNKIFSVEPDNGDNELQDVAIGGVNNVVPVRKNSDSIQWDTCCSRTSKNFVVYIAQMSIAVVILSFASVLAVVEEDKTPWLNIVSFVLGVVFPSPSIGK